jgi:hypothetical protein
MIFRQDLLDFATASLKKFLSRFAEIISCYRLDPSPNAADGLLDLMTSVSLLEQDSHIAKLMAEPAFHQLDEPTQFRRVLDELFRSYADIFLRLYDRGALDRICILPEGEDLPQAALLQLSEMRRAIESEPEPKPKTSAPAPVDPVHLSPEDQCVNDYYELGSSQFKARWISHVARRETYEVVCQQGRI